MCFEGEGEKRNIVNTKKNRKGMVWNILPFGHRSCTDQNIIIMGAAFKPRTLAVSNMQSFPQRERPNEKKK